MEKLWKVADKVAVSTDDKRIADAVQDLAIVIPRPAEYSVQTNLVAGILTHALHYLMSDGGYTPDIILHMTPCTPLVSVKMLQLLVDTLISGPAYKRVDLIYPCSVCAQKLVRIEHDRIMPYIKDDPYRGARQLHEQAYMPVWVFARWYEETLLKYDRVGEDVIYPMDGFVIGEPGTHVDVDSEEDMKTAEKLWTLQQNKDCPNENR